MKEIPLTNSPLVTLVDDEDYELLMMDRWQLKKDGAVYRWRGAKKRTILMHRAIMKAPSGVEVDHKNRNRRDNRKRNLRFATHTQNLNNQAGHRDGTSKFKGVSWNKGAQRWKARINVAKREFHLGYFSDEEDAARTYNDAARRLFGEFAWLNPL